MPAEIVIEPAQPEHVESVHEFLQPYMDQHLLLPRSRQEILKLMTHGFVARDNGQIVGFAAVEIYSRKLAEVQCLAVDADYRRQGIGSLLVRCCVRRAAEQQVLELMAISASDEMFLSCGFDYSLPNQKRALFIQPLLTAENDHSDEHLQKISDQQVSQSENSGINQ
jgi:amino-acid N-acetyltransferase